jgi:hypothetical protein
MQIILAYSHDRGWHVHLASIYTRVLKQRQRCGRRFSTNLDQRSELLRPPLGGLFIEHSISPGTLQWQNQPFPVMLFVDYSLSTRQKLITTTKPKARNAF